MQQPPQTTLLLVEDTRELARVLAHELEAGGNRALHVSAGRAALDRHAREHSDLVLLDVLRELRATTATPILTFIDPGTYDHRCTPRGGMRGQVVVAEDPV